MITQVRLVVALPSRSAALERPYCCCRAAAARAAACHPPRDPLPPPPLQMADNGESSTVPGSKTPADFLKSIKGKPVVVKLNSGVDYRGERE